MCRIVVTAGPFTLLSSRSVAIDTPAPLTAYVPFVTSTVFGLRFTASIRFVAAVSHVAYGDTDEPSADT